MEEQRRDITGEVAKTLALRYARYFGGHEALVGRDYETAYEIARRHVLTRDDLLPAEHEPVLMKVMGQASQYGPLLPFFVGGDAREITEVLVNPAGSGRPRVYIGRHGRQYYAGDDYFQNDREVKEYAQMVCHDSGRDFTEATPAVDAWLRDGSRVSVFGYKASPAGTALTIRKSPLSRPALPLARLVEHGMFPPLAAALISDLLVGGHANFGCFGRTDSGKTTVVRAAGEFFGRDERVMIGEVSFELAFPGLPNCLNLVEVGIGEEKILTLSHICELFLRNNPDRTIAGEIRSGEAVAAAEMAETTSGGFITTGHAGGLNELRARLPKMFARGGMELNREHVDGQIQTMFHFLLFFDKAWDGSRLLLSLMEVGEGRYRTLIRFDEEEFAATGGRVKRWVYESPVSEKRLSRLAFRGARVLRDFETVKEKYLYASGE
jgi:pilus assembly protein CpaF